MWVRLQLFPDRPHLHVAILDNGKVFIKATDVGFFLGYKDTYGFSVRHARTDLMKILPREFSVKFRHMVFTFDEMLAVIRKRKCNYYVQKKLIQEIHRLWYKEGRVQEKFPMIPSFTIRDPFPITVTTQGDIGLQEWFKRYAVQVRDCFARCRARRPADDYANPASVPSRRADGPVDDYANPASVPSRLPSSASTNFGAVKSIMPIYFPSSLASDCSSHTTLPIDVPDDSSDIDSKEPMNKVMVPSSLASDCSSHTTLPIDVPDDSSNIDSKEPMNKVMVPSSSYAGTDNLPLPSSRQEPMDLNPTQADPQPKQM